MLEFEYALPEHVGLNELPLHDLRQFVRAGTKSLHAVAILAGGKVVFEEYGPNSGGDAQLHSIYSVTKSVSSILIGLALDEATNGDQTLCKKILYGPIQNLLGDKNFIDPLSKTLTLHHLLAQTTGIRWKETGRTWGPDHSLWQMEESPNWIEFVLNSNFSGEPGTRFNYNSGVSHLLPWLASKICDKDPLQLIRRRLFEPLGIMDFQWDKDPQGNLGGGKGLRIQATDLLRLGHLILQGGKIGRQQIIPLWFLEESIKAQSKGHIYYGKYGYHWWLKHLTQGPPASIEEPNVVCGIGYGGQFLYIVPRWGICAVFLGHMINQDFEIPQKLFAQFVLPARWGHEDAPRGWN